MNKKRIVAIVILAAMLGGVLLSMVMLVFGMAAGAQPMSAPSIAAAGSVPLWFSQVGT